MPTSIPESFRERSSCAARRSAASEKAGAGRATRQGTLLPFAAERASGYPGTAPARPRGETRRVNTDQGRPLMRKTLAVAVAAALLASPALADTKREVDRTKKAIQGSGSYGLAGCGLGSMAFGKEPGFVQVLAATTNGFLWTQLFGITRGP